MVKRPLGDANGIEVTRPETDVVLIRLARPQAHNALNGELLLGIELAITEAEADARTRVIILTGAGTKAFCAGADLAELSGVGVETAFATMRRGHDILRKIERSRVPVIAAVNGLALGGGFELMLACAFSVIADHAELGFPEAGLGLIPGYGGTQRLARRVGSVEATYAMLTGARMKANRAFQLGLSPVPPVPVDELISTALDIAQNITSKSASAIEAIRAALDAGLEGPLDTGLAFEAALAALALNSADGRSGISAFLEKRRPAFGRHASGLGPDD